MKHRHYKLIRKGYDRGMYNREICQHIIGRNGKPVSPQYVSLLARKWGLVRADRPTIRL